MKTKIITGLKKEVLIIEISSNYGFNINKNRIALYDCDEKERMHIKGNYTLLGKIDEIKEEDVRSLVSDFDAFENSKYYYLHGFWKLIEKEIHWVNPCGNEPKEPECECECEERYEDFEIKYNDFMIAQEKTFDRNGTLIFVKN